MRTDLIRIDNHPPLRPCPFCGCGGPVVARDTGAMPTAGIFCPGCEILFIVRPGRTVAKAVEIAVAAWNRCPAKGVRDDD